MTACPRCRRTGPPGWLRGRDGPLCRDCSVERAAAERRELAALHEAAVELLWRARWASAERVAQVLGDDGPD